jgi:3-hydroxyisobutyrate dehydrogenase
MPEGVTKAAARPRPRRGAEVVITMLPNGEILRAVAG